MLKKTHLKPTDLVQPPHLIDEKTGPEREMSSLKPPAGDGRGEQSGSEVWTRGQSVALPCETPCVKWGHTSKIPFLKSLGPDVFQDAEFFRVQCIYWTLRDTPPGVSGSAS